jgi:hypothetical protein
MARRIGFNDPKGTGPGDAKPEVREARERGLAEQAAERPKVQRNWTRIVFQIFWVDVWIIAGFTIGQDIFESAWSEEEAVTLDQVLLLSMVLLGGFISVRKLLRLLRGHPVATPGS